MASTTGKTNPQYRPASRRPMPRNAPSGKPARPSREPVPQERYRTGTAKPKRRRMRSMKAHIWDTGVFFSVLLLLITGLIALFSASYTNAMSTRAVRHTLSCVRAFSPRSVLRL